MLVVGAAVAVQLVSAAVLTLAMAPAAQAASFDCAKASSQVEKSICANPDLSRADEVLARAYATALGGLSDAARQAMQAGQREWLGFAALACTVDAKPFGAAPTEDQQGCLNSVYRSRISELGQSRMEGDWRVYPRTSYSLVDDPDPDAYQGVATKEISSPRIDEESPRRQLQRPDGRGRRGRAAGPQERGLPDRGHHGDDDDFERRIAPHFVGDGYVLDGSRSGAWQLRHYLCALPER